MSRNIYLAIGCALAAASLAAADIPTITLTPMPADLYDLDHTKVYLWGFAVALDPGKTVVAAALKFDNIRNWDDQPNELYAHLLDMTTLGVQERTDNEGGGDYFAHTYTGVHEHLVTYQNLTTTPHDLVYNFDQTDLSALNVYLGDGRAGIGLDPDCHFYNDGVSLTLTTTPEPASYMLLGVGGVAILRRRRGA
jgi:hypothetical protein